MKTPHKNLIKLIKDKKEKKNNLLMAESKFQ